MDTPGSANPRNAFCSAILDAEIPPGQLISYELCKDIYLYHPLGLKLVEAPINIALSQVREISGVPDEVKEQFSRQWDNSQIYEVIFDTMRQARIYGISTCVEVDPGIYSVFDPLVTAGSLVLNQNKLSPDFLKVDKVVVDNRTFNKDQSVVIMNERPIYLAWTNSAFGYVGRSVFQRAIYPLQSFMIGMVTDRMVMQKAGVLVAKMKKVASAVDRVIQAIASSKRNLLKEARTYNVLQIGTEESIETLPMQQIADAKKVSKDSILDDIAAAIDMPTILLKSEVLNQGFGEGTEDAKVIANYIARFRNTMEPLFQFFIPRIQKLAWNEEFYSAFQNANEEYRNIPYNVAYLQWVRDFEYLWPNLLTEPDSEKAKLAETRLSAVTNVFNLLNATVSSGDRKQLTQWVMDTVNSEINQLVFPEPLLLELDGDFSTPQPTVMTSQIKEESSISPKEDVPNSVS